MKKTIVKTLIIAIMMMAISTIIYAAEPQITLEGDSTIEPGKTKILTVKVTSDNEVGTVSGKIEKSENISEIKVAGKNNWNLTYNQNEGTFVIYKAEGSKSEEIMTIEYTVANEEGTANIKVSNLKLTTLDYETKDAEDISKDVTIKNETQETATLAEIKITKAPTKVKYVAGEKFDKTGMVVTAAYSDGTTKEVTGYTYTPAEALKETDKKIVVTYKEGDVEKTAEQEITVTASTENGNNNSGSDKNLPKTGFGVNIAIIIAAITLVSLISYIGYQKNKNA